MDISLKNETVRRWILGAVALVLALVVVGRGLSGYRASAVRELQNAYEMKALEYRRFSKLLANKDRYLRVRTELEEAAQGIGATRFLSAKTTSLAEVRFQELIDNLARENELGISSRKVLKATEVGDLKELRVSITARTEIGALNDFLFDLGDQETALFVESMEIKRLADPLDRYCTFNAVLKAYAL